MKNTKKKNISKNAQELAIYSYKSYNSKVNRKNPSILLHTQEKIPTQRQHKKKCKKYKKPKSNEIICLNHHYMNPLI